MTLLVDLGVAFLLLSGVTAVLAGILHGALGSLIARLPPEWRAQLRLGALLAPPVVGALGVVVVLLPSLLELAGVANDHCLDPLEHGHEHICVIHQPAGVSFPLAVLVGSLGSVVLLRLGLVLGRWWSSRQRFASVIRTSSMRALAEGEYLFDSDIPVCVTSGLVRPKVYISSAAVAALGSDCVAAALAHERGHVLRQETRARFVAALAEAFHLPISGRSILRHWKQDAEFACDQFAARQARSPLLVAEALVRFQRAALHGGAVSPCASACLCSASCELSARVTRLVAMESGLIALPPEKDWPLAYPLGVALLLVGLGLQAPHLHHFIESFVGLIASAVA